MSDYQHILVSIDLNEDYSKVIEKAINLRSEKCRLSILNCVNQVSYPVDYDHSLSATHFRQDFQNAELEINRCISRYNIAIEPDDIHVTTGNPGKAICRYAKEHNVDLVVMGGHGKHGIALLFGSSSSEVIHHATFDCFIVSLL